MRLASRSRLAHGMGQSSTARLPARLCESAVVAPLISRSAALLSWPAQPQTPRLVCRHYRRAAVRGHIPRGCHHDLRIVAKVPDAHIAAGRADRGLGPSRVVVDVPPFTAAARLGGLADRAPAALERDKAVPLFLVTGRTARVSGGVPWPVVVPFRAGLSGRTGIQASRPGWSLPYRRRSGGGRGRRSAGVSARRPQRPCTCESSRSAARQPCGSG